jgi:hypothetical protein
LLKKMSNPNKIIIDAKALPTVKELELQLQAAKRLQSWADIQDDEDKDKTDKKIISVPRPMSMVRAMVMGRAKVRSEKFRGKSRDIFMATLCQDGGTTTGSINTVLNTVFDLSPVNAQDWSAFGAVWDECRCLGVHFAARIDATMSTTTTGFSQWGMQFDPTTKPAAGSLADVLNALHHVGPIAIPGNVGSAVGYQGSPGITNKDGFVHLRFCKIPFSRATSDQSGGSGLVGGGWIGTNIATASDAVVGYLKPYVKAAAGMTPNFTYFVWFEMEFRARI